MQNDVVEVAIRGVRPMANGCAVFLGNPEKTFVIYVDHSVGNAIQMGLHGVKKERPLTHDLIGLILTGFEIEVERIIINDMHEGTFFARLIFKMKNEIGTKIVEIDARPSDSMVLALQRKRPVFVSEAVFNTVEDMTEDLERILKEQAEEGDGEQT